jgi:MFS family permease
MNSTDSAVFAGPRMRQVAVASYVGTTIEFYDFYIYGTAAALVFPAVFFPVWGSTGATVAFIARPLGAMAFGHYGDRIGRRRTLLATLLLTGVSTLLIGLLPGAATIGVAAPIGLVALRFVQGFALGGEWAGAALLTVEYAPPGQRGRYAMVPQLSPAIVVALSSAVFLLTGLLPGNIDHSFLDYGWRIPFLISAVLIGVGVYVRSKVAETPVFRQAQHRQLSTQTPLNTQTPLREAFTRASREILLTAGTVTMGFALFYTGTTYLTSYGTHPTGAALPQALVLSFGIAAGAAMAAGVALSAVSSDRFGRRTVIMMSCAVAAVWSLLLVPLLDTHSPVAFGVGIIVTLGLQGLAYGPAGALLPETFPTQYRYTGAGTSYHLAAAVGGGIPPLLATLLAAAFGTFAIGVLLCALSLLSMFCVKALAETKDRDFQDIQPGVAPRPADDDNDAAAAARQWLTMTPG